MTQQTIAQMADDILGGILTDPGKLKSKSHLQENQEELPEVTPEQHAALMGHVLEEDKTKAQVVKQKIRIGGKKVKQKIERVLRKGEDDANQAGVVSTGQGRAPVGSGTRPQHKLRDHMENLSNDQIETLKKAKEIVSEMTGVGSIGVNMSGGDESSHHPALQVKLPGDKDQAKQIKAASTPPAMQLKAIKGQSPKGHYVNNKAGVKRKSSSSKDDETQRRVHDDMSAMYHESFDSFVDGILLKEDATGKRYKGDVSVAEFGRKGPANDTFGGGGIQTGGRGPVVKLTKNQLMTAKKKSAGSGQDKGENGFGKASSHSRKHPQNPYAGGK
tara:strand:+ start:315 stop:1304 length:990 start_codon:yes stop_codon:yes gene_type:complete